MIKRKSWKMLFVSCPTLMKCLRSDLCPTSGIFDLSDDNLKGRQFDILSALLCVAHALPLACRSEEALADIFTGVDTDSNKFKKRWSGQNFHGHWNLDGWNDEIIQLARDAVLNYYRVRINTDHRPKLTLFFQRYAPESDVEVYMRLNNL